MIKKINIYKWTLAFLTIIPFLIISCAEDIIDNNAGKNIINDNVVTLAAVIDFNNPGARSSLAREGTQLKTHWTGEDKIWIYCEKISNGSRELIAVDNNPVNMIPNPNNPTTGSMSFTIPAELEGTTFNIVGCSDSYYSEDFQPNLTGDGSIIFNIGKSDFYKTDKENVRIPMFFHHTILADGSNAAPVQFKNMGSLILLSLKNTTSSSITGRFNWTTTTTAENPQFYYVDKGFKTGCYNGAGDVIDGSFSDNSIVDISDTPPAADSPSYAIDSQETIELAAWFAPVKNTKITNLAVDFVTENGGVRSGKVNLNSSISPRIGKAYAFYGNITGWNITLNKEKYLDVTDSDGTFVVCEGNMSDSNGMLVYYDKNGQEYINAFKNANNGLEIGNVVQDMYIANGKVYLLTQNGDNMGGAGRFVVCDARTMKMEYADPLIIKTPEGKATWPQHLVVTSDNKAYVQYSEAGMEATSGIVELELGDKSVTVKNTVEGTFGRFTVDGTTKARMVYSRGKVYAGNGHHVVIIDPENGVVENKLTFEGQQVKGIVKAADGNIYFALAGKFDGNQNFGVEFTSPAQIVGINHQGDIISTQDCPDEIEFPVATWSPAINMCASFTDPHLYFNDSKEFSMTTASRYNYETKTFDVNYIKFDGWDSIYGIMGVHPTTKKLWVSRSTNGYTTGTVYVYDVSGSSPVLENTYVYPNRMGASPAGIDFGYRFTSTWVNK